MRNDNKMSARLSFDLPGRLFRFASVALVLCLANATNGEELADLIERCEKAVVRIDIPDGLGSGFVVDGNGTFCTNFHVMAGASEGTAIFNDGRKFKILGTYLMDPKRDLVIGKIEGQNLTSLPVAQTLPRKGESVMALGCPIGFNFSVSNGIVSGVRSAAEVNGGRNDHEGQWLQFDASISPGNSGGPLVNRAGEVVAMNTFMIANKAQNMNFGISCIDINQAIRMAKSLPLVPLSAGAAKSEMPDTQQDDELEIPNSAVQQYVDATRRDLESLMKSTRTEVKKQRETRVQYNKAPINGAIEGDAGLVRYTDRSTGRSFTSFVFRTEEVRQRYMRARETRANELIELGKLQSQGATNEVVAKFALGFGPPLDTRKAGSVGFMSNVQVIDVANEFLVVIEYEDRPYLLKLDATTGLFPGSEIPPMPVFVAGNQVVPRSGSSINVTLLASVPIEKIQRAAKVAPSASSAVASGGASGSTDGLTGESRSSSDSSFAAAFAPEADAGRIWMSRDGKFTVNASLVSYDAKSGKVKLKKIDDGKVIDVPLKALCDVDQRFVSGK